MAEVGCQQHWRALRSVPRSGVRSRGRRGSGMLTQESPFSGAHADPWGWYLHGRDSSCEYNHRMSDEGETFRDLGKSRNRC